MSRMRACVCVWMWIWVCGCVGVCVCMRVGGCGVFELNHTLLTLHVFTRFYSQHPNSYPNLYLSHTLIPKTHSHPLTPNHTHTHSFTYINSHTLTHSHTHIRYNIHAKMKRSNKQTREERGKQKMWRSQMRKKSPYGAGSQKCLRPNIPSSLCCNLKLLLCIKGENKTSFCFFKIQFKLIA